MKKTELYILIVIVLVSSILSISLLTRGHVWLDDFASYIMQAQSLLHGTPQEFFQRNTFTIQESSYLLGPFAYPWGYPLLLVPVLAIFGLKVLALKLVGTLFLVFFLFVFYRLARLRLPPTWCLLLTAILAFNPPLLEASDFILSDLPFLFFSTLAIFLIEKALRAGEPAPSSHTSTRMGVVIFAAFMIRTNGLLLLGALAVAQSMRFRSMQEIRENLTAILFPYIIFGALAGLQYLLLPGGEGSHLTHYSMLTLQRLLDNALYYLQLPGEMFKDIPLGGIFFALTILSFLAGLYANPRKNAAFLTYIFLTLAVFISWPERQGLRFLFPSLPFILLIAAEGVAVAPPWRHWQFAMEKLRVERTPLARWTTLGLAGALAVLSLFIAAQAGWVNLQNGRAINGPFDPVSGELFEFLREQTPADSAVIFFKPRALRLLTDRDSFMTVTCEDFSKADYVVFHEKQGSHGQVAEPEACTNVGLSVVFNNRRFTVYQVTP